MSYGGKAEIKDGDVVIRVPLAALPQVLEGAWATCALDTRYKLTDVDAFAKELVSALNDEDEEGSTAIHKMFDAAIEEAINQGAQGIEEHEDQEV